MRDTDVTNSKKGLKETMFYREFKIFIKNTGQTIYAKKGEIFITGVKKSIGSSGFRKVISSGFKILSIDNKEKIIEILNY